MKHSSIEVGHIYVAKVGSAITHVRVDSIQESPLVGEGKGSRYRYHVTNLQSKRRTIFRSASKFRREVSPKPLP